MLDLDNAYKLRAEQRLRDHDGASFAAVALSAAVAFAGPVLWHLFCTSVCPSVQRQRGWRRYTVEGGLLIPAIVASVLLPAWVPPLLVAGAALPLLRVLPAALRRAAPVTDERGRLRSVTYFRSMLMLLTVCCILAVDFPVFPPEHMKTEVWGVSLMDIGAGAAVFSHGVVTGRRVTLRSGLAAWARSSLPLLVLGVCRIAMIKGTNYQEHLTEYGVHWNFFFTLALMPVLYLPLRGLAAVAGLPVAAQGLALTAAHQLWLLRGGTDFLLSPAREGVVGMNKEGLSGLFGYLAVFLFGCEYARHLSSIKRQVICTALLWVGAAAADAAVQRCSRRLCNSSFALYVSAHSALFLALAALGDACCAARAEAGGAAAADHAAQTSRLLAACNSRALALFLAGNVATGAVNLAVPTLDCSAGTSVAILLAHSAASAGVAVCLEEFAGGGGKAAQGGRGASLQRAGPPG
eukprot:TRINITY_DN27570_c0_g1_i1.p1 TRINITY_DN27570_c0_g1~~TRINITY_DN27570_c0_g1_i1.p1  ORF type:complete len:494 (+),score=165.64 TRINITY_DN27570_c0_g1_i1:91-1482(+)